MRVIIETPKGQGQKYDYDPGTGNFMLKKVMPAGMVFPFDFGFFPGTVGGDGDPVDVLVLAEMETFPGCMMECRVIGAITAEQQERDGKKMRNDRYLAVPEVSLLYASINSLEELPEETLNQLEAFFANYNNQAGKKFKVLERVAAAQALKMLEVTPDHTLQPQRLIQIYLPLYDPKGKALPESLYKEIKDTLTEKFGGLTMYTRSPAEGFWKEEQEKTVKDDILIYEVLTPEMEKDFWLPYKEKLKKLFKQEELLISCASVTIV